MFLKRNVELERRFKGLERFLQGKKVSTRFLNRGPLGKALNKLISTLRLRNIILRGTWIRGSVYMGDGRRKSSSKTLTMRMKLQRKFQ